MLPIIFQRSSSHMRPRRREPACIRRRQACPRLAVRRGSCEGAYRRARSRWGQTYNVDGRNERNSLQVVESICDLLDDLAPSKNGTHRRLITFVADRPGHDRRCAIDTSKLERDLVGARKRVSKLASRKQFAGTLRKKLGGKQFGSWLRGKKGRAGKLIKV